MHEGKQANLKESLEITFKTDKRIISHASRQEWRPCLFFEELLFLEEAQSLNEDCSEKVEKLFL